MVKVHIIADVQADIVQNAINDFIKDKAIIDIKYQSLIVNIGNNTAANDRVLIIYSE